MKGRGRYLKDSRKLYRKNQKKKNKIRDRLEKEKEGEKVIVSIPADNHVHVTRDSKGNEWVIFKRRREQDNHASSSSSSSSSSSGRTTKSRPKKILGLTSEHLIANAGVSELEKPPPLQQHHQPPQQSPTTEMREQQLPVQDENESISVDKNGVLPSLATQAKALEDAFNRLEGVTCDKAEDGIYLFPSIQFPQRAIMAAEAAKTLPDACYTKRLREATGIFAVPGSDYGQVPGIWYIGLSILLQKEKLPAIITRLTDFHRAFMAEFHD